MTMTRAVVRAVVVALAIWAGQTVMPSSNRIGIWAMVSLGIGSAVLGMLLTRLITYSHRRWSAGLLNFVGTTVILLGFYLLLPKRPAMVMPDLILAFEVGVLSGLTEGFLPERTQNDRYS